MPCSAWRGWVRRDQVNYYPSPDPFNDLGPLQAETLSQLRYLTNAGLRSSISYVKGVHNLKVGFTAQHTFLNENDSFGIVDPGLLAAQGCPDPTNPICVTLTPYDLTAGGTSYKFRGKTDVIEYCALRAGHHHQRALVHQSWTSRGFL